MKKLRKTWNVCVRTVAQVGFTKGAGWDLSDQQAREKLNVPSLDTLLARRVAQWIGHVARMPSHRLPRALLFGTIANRE